MLGRLEFTWIGLEDETGMEKTKLRELLQELHQELETTAEVEPSTRELLRGVAREIDETLERGGPRPEPGEEEGSFEDRLGEAFVEFEADHPRLAFITQRIVKLLSDIGI